MTDGHQDPPRFSILTPLRHPETGLLRETLTSVLGQGFTAWEWVVVDDGSLDPTAAEAIRRAAADDPRIRVVEGGTGGHVGLACEAALDAARGEFVVLLDQDDLLGDDALARVDLAIGAPDGPDGRHGTDGTGGTGEVDYVYTDEDDIDAEGRSHDAFRKPIWSPTRLLGQMYTGHLSVLRRSLVIEVGGFRDGFDGGHQHDLVLRVTERARRVVPVPEVLYHRRVARDAAGGDPRLTSSAVAGGRRAVQEALRRRGSQGTVVDAPQAGGHYVVEGRLDPATRVSVVIPTIGQSGIVWGTKQVFVVEAVRSALARTSHPELEIVVVYDSPTPPEVLRELHHVAGDRLVLVPFRAPFNFSEKCNVGVVRSTGSRVVLLNDDVRVISERWLENLVAPLDDPRVGMTGAKLYFADGTVQHAGHRYVDGEFTHPYSGCVMGDPGRRGDLVVSREVSGVTAACAALRRDVYEQVGGLSEILPVNFNDVDFSYKVRHAGLDVVWVANCELYHFESRTRQHRIEEWEYPITIARWGVPGRDDYLPVL